MPASTACSQRPERRLSSNVLTTTIMRSLFIISAGLLAACGGGPKPFPAPIPLLQAKPQTAFSLQIVDGVAGTGALAEPAKCFYVHYTGWLTDGKKFDSSHDSTAAGTPREPISFAQGARRVIPGWDAGFEGIRVGGRRRLIVPYQLAYGEKGRPPVIPPKATLVFDVELMAVGEAEQPGPGETPRGYPPMPKCAPWETVAKAQR